MSVAVNGSIVVMAVATGGVSDGIALSGGTVVAGGAPACGVAGTTVGLVFVPGAPPVTCFNP